MNRAATITKGAAALVLLTALAAGVPWALWHFVGWPLPHRLPPWSQLSASLTQHSIADTTLLKTLACVVWVAWAVLAVSLAVEIPAAVRGRTAGHLSLAGPLQPVVAQLLAAVAIAVLSLSARPSGAGPGSLGAALRPALAARPIPAMALSADTAPTPFAATAAPQPGFPATPGPMAAPGRTYLVARNDTLWGIAERELGDPLRWRDIYTLNQDRPQPGGARLVDPHWIDPGWTLLLPDDGTQPAGPPATTNPPAEPAPGQVKPHAPAHTTATPATPGSAPATAPAARPEIPAGQERPAAAATGTTTPGTVSLPTGSLVAGSFAAGVLCALSLARLRRRHGYQPGPPEPGRSLTPPPLGPTIRRLAAGLVPPDSEDSPPIPDPPRNPGPPPGPDDAGDPAAEEVIEIGERDGGSVTAAPAELSGTALCGPAADRVARAWATALLTRVGSLGAEIVATSATQGRLFPNAGEPPGLRPVEDAAQLIRLLESEVVIRTRKLLAAGAHDAASYRYANPDEPFPAVLALIDQLTPLENARLAPTIQACPRLAVTVVFLADTEAATSRLHLDGSLVARVEPAGQVGHLAGCRLFGLEAAEATDVLCVLAAAEFRPTSEDNPEWTEVIERMEHPPPATEAWPEQNLPQARREATPIRVRALGPLTITVSGRTVSRGLRSVAKELLVYYLLRPEGATVDQAVDHLWPDTDPKLVHRQFWTAASNLRTCLRQGAEAESKILNQEGDLYRLDPTVVSADLWDFQTALAEAAQAPDDPTAAAALRRAVDAYSGELAQGAGWIWIEPPREDLHRRALNAHLRLAELEQGAAHPAGAEAILERAIELDRYAEEPYRRLMTLQAARGDTDAVKATLRNLHRCLAEADLDPDPATARLYRRLVTDDANQRPGGQ